RRKRRGRLDFGRASNHTVAKKTAQSNPPTEMTKEIASATPFHSPAARACGCPVPIITAWDRVQVCAARAGCFASDWMCDRNVVCGPEVAASRVLPSPPEHLAVELNVRVSRGVDWI